MYVGHKRFGGWWGKNILWIEILEKLKFHCKPSDEGFNGEHGRLVADSPEKPVSERWVWSSASTKWAGKRCLCFDWPGSAEQKNICLYIYVILIYISIYAHTHTYFPGA